MAEAIAIGLRCFLAITLPPEVRARLAGLQDSLRGQVAGARWVSPDDLHVTLRFYGELEPVGLDALVPALAQAVGGSGAITIGLRGLGAFPAPGRARVLWVGVDEGDEALRGLHRRVEDASRALGLAPEERPYHPHVTLARLREPASVVEVARRLDGTPWGRWTAGEVVLFQSRLTPRGPVYTPLARFALQGA